MEATVKTLFSDFYKRFFLISRIPENLNQASRVTNDTTHLLTLGQSYHPGLGDIIICSICYKMIFRYHSYGGSYGFNISACIRRLQAVLQIIEQGCIMVTTVKQFCINEMKCLHYSIHWFNQNPHSHLVILSINGF